MKTINRRSFLRHSGIAGAGLMMPAITFGKSILPAKKYSFDSWSDIRAQFSLNPDRIHLAQMLFASHPKPVQDAIEMHRRKFDENPVEYLEANLFSMPDAVRKSAASFIKAEPEEIVLTDSTTLGIAVLYHGLKLKGGDEILTTTHDHYITEKALEFSSRKNGAVIRRIAEYDDPYTVGADEIVSRFVKAVTPATRIVAITWVHSCTGMKLPVRAIADAIKEINAKRSADNRIYLCVDGVHGFGIENVTMEDLGCDFFAAGTHKWIFGPRGTGILWGKKEAWEMMMPVIPSFGYNSYGEWLGLVTPDKLNFGDWITPGGFKVYEHQWALPAAFDFQLKIGRDKISERTHRLNTLFKEGLKSMSHIKLHTPMSPELSAGINCFEVDGYKAEEVVKKLYEKKILSSASPYRVSYVRVTPSIVNTEEEVKTCLDALESL